MWTKGLIVVVLLGIIGALFSALWALTRQRTHRLAVVKALTLRVLLSVMLFGALILGSHWGWFASHGLRYNQ